MFKAFYGKKAYGLKRFVAVMLLSVMVALPVFAFFSSSLITAKAEPARGTNNTSYDSWVSQWGNTYDGVRSFTQDDSYEDKLTDRDDWFSGIVNTTISFVIRETVGSLLVLLMDSLNLSLEKIVYGRVGVGWHEGATATNWYQFGLEDGNIYGSVGSILYALFRNFVFALMAVQFVWILGSFLVNGTGKGRADVKSAIYNFIFMFTMLYAMPVMVDLILFIRDSLLKQFVTLTAGVRNGYKLGVTNVIVDAAASDHTIVGAILLCFTVGSTIYFMFSYLKIAIQQAYLFGVFPIVAFRSFTDKQIFNKWIGQFVTSLFVPLLDAVGLFFVVLINDNYTNAEGNYGPVILGLVVFMSIIPCRNAILQLFGMPVPGKGFSLAAAALMMMRMAGRRSGGNGKGDETPKNKAPEGSEGKPIEKTGDSNGSMPSIGGGTGSGTNNGINSPEGIGGAPEQDVLNRDGSSVMGDNVNNNNGSGGSSQGYSSESTSETSDTTSSIETDSVSSENIITGGGQEILPPESPELRDAVPYVDTEIPDAEPYTNAAAQAEATADASAIGNGSSTQEPDNSMLDEQKETVNNPEAPNDENAFSDGDKETISNEDENRNDAIENEDKNELPETSDEMKSNTEETSEAGGEPLTAQTQVEQAEIPNAGEQTQANGQPIESSDRQIQDAVNAPETEPINKIDTTDHSEVKQSAVPGAGASIEPSQDPSQGRNEKVSSDSESKSGSHGSSDLKGSPVDHGNLAAGNSNAEEGTFRELDHDRKVSSGTGKEKADLYNESTGQKIGSAKVSNADPEREAKRAERRAKLDNLKSMAMDTPGVGSAISYSSAAGQHIGHSAASAASSAIKEHVQFRRTTPDGKWDAKADIEAATRRLAKLGSVAGGLAGASVTAISGDTNTIMAATMVGSMAGKKATEKVATKGGEAFQTVVEAHKKGAEAVRANNDRKYTQVPEKPKQSYRNRPRIEKVNPSNESVIYQGQAEPAKKAAEPTPKETYAKGAEPKSMEEQQRMEGKKIKDTAAEEARKRFDAVMAKGKKAAEEAESKIPKKADKAKDAEERFDKAVGKAKDMAAEAEKKLTESTAKASESADNGQQKTDKKRKSGGNRKRKKNDE